MKINIEEVQIRLCDSNDVDDIYKIENIVIDNFKENEKGYFLPFLFSLKYSRICGTTISKK